MCTLPSRCVLPISLRPRSRFRPSLARVQALLHSSGPQSRTRLSPSGVERVRGNSGLVLNTTWSLSWARCRCLLRSSCVWQAQSRLRSSSSSTRTSPVEFRGSQSGATSAHKKRASRSSPLIEHRSHPPQTLRCGSQLTNTHPTYQWFGQIALVATTMTMMKTWSWMLRGRRPPESAPNSAPRRTFTTGP